MPTHTTLRPLPKRSVFVRHVAERVALAAIIVALSLGAGTIGYHWFEKLGWIDALLNAAMILTGMGPVDHLESRGGKLFATGYALFSGIVFLSVATIVLSPIAKRALHKLHLDMNAKDD